MRRDTLFRIASMTKPVTVAAAMSLVDEGKLALREPIVRCLPEFTEMRVLDDPNGPLDRTHPAQRAILVEDLLTHTSGLAYGFTVGGPISRACFRLPFGQGPDAWLAALADLPLVHQPGERLTYSHAIDVLGVLLSRVEGKPFHQVLDERILQPAGMSDTGFCVSPDGRRRVATMYRLDENDRLRHDVMGPPRLTPPEFCNAGGGLWSTAGDYLRFVEMLLRDGTLDGVRCCRRSPRGRCARCAAPTGRWNSSRAPSVQPLRNFAGWIQVVGYGPAGELPGGLVTVLGSTPWRSSPPRSIGPRSGGAIAGFGSPPGAGESGGLNPSVSGAGNMPSMLASAPRRSCWLKPLNSEPAGWTAGTSILGSGGDAGASTITPAPTIAAPAMMYGRSANRMAPSIAGRRL